MAIRIAAALLMLSACTQAGPATLFGDRSFAIAWTDDTKLAFDPNSILLEMVSF
jgi:hypothetical protein